MRVGLAGNNLSILISADHSFYGDWSAFATVTSLGQMVPDAEIALSCPREFNKIQYYKWTASLNIKMLMHQDLGKQINCQDFNKLYAVFLAIKNQIVKFPLLVVEAGTVAASHLSLDLINHFQNYDFVTDPNFNVWYFKKSDILIQRTINDFKKFASQCRSGIIEAIKSNFEPSIVDEFFVLPHEHILGTFTRLPAEFRELNYIPFEANNFFKKKISINEHSIIKLMSGISSVYPIVSK